MNSYQNESNRGTTDERAFHWLDKLSKLSGLAVLATGFFTAYGYLYARAYFTELGAPWAVDQISAQSLVLSAAPLVYSTLSGAMAAYFYKSLGAQPRKRFIFFTMLLVTTLATVASLFFIRGLPSLWDLVGVALSLYGIGFGILTFFFVIRMKTGSLFRGGDMPGILEMYFFFSLFGAPLIHGSFVGGQHSDPDYSPLAPAKVVGSSEQWRVVKTFGDKTLLMRPAALKRDRVFKVVPVEQLQIGGTRERI